MRDRAPTEKTGKQMTLLEIIDHDKAREREHMRIALALARASENLTAGDPDSIFAARERVASEHPELRPTTVVLAVDTVAQERD